MKFQRAIPYSIKRKVRQACGFGCAICGHPIFEYDHIIPFSKVKEHKVANLCCLCPNHHADKTRKLIDEKLIAKARNNPFNLRNKNVTTHPFFFYGDECVIEIGSFYNYCQRGADKSKIYEYAPLVMANEEIIKIKFGPEDFLLLDLLVKNSNNEIVVAIIENELITKLNFWDIEFKGQILTVKERREHGVEIFFEMTIDAPSRIAIRKAHLYNKWSQIKVQGDYIIDMKNKGRFSNSAAINCRYGIVFYSNEKFNPCLYSIG